MVQSLAQSIYSILKPIEIRSDKAEIEKIG